MTTADINPKGMYEFDVDPKQPPFGLLNNYDLSVRVPGTCVVEIGRFSASMLPKVRAIPSRGTECEVSIGAFCEAGRGASILVGGEHPNSSIFNYSFGAACEYYRAFMDNDTLSRGVLRSQGIQIGDNVLLSQNAKVLDGVVIGSGSVLAAGAVAVKDCLSYSIYGGVPARLLKSRFDDQKVKQSEALRLPFIRAHHVHRLPDLIDRLETGSCSYEDVLSQIEHMVRRPKILFQGGLNADGAIGLGSIVGFAIDDEAIDDEGALSHLRSYFGQYFARQSRIKWTPDIFHALGIS